MPRDDGGAPLHHATLHATMRGTMARSQLEIRNLGPIESADLTFGDLTVFTGPQASGKSIALQTLKLAVDQPAIVRRMSDQGLAWRDAGTFQELYYGTGMRSLWSSATTTRWERRSLKPAGSPPSRAPDADERVAYIPAQRVMSLRDGWTRPFDAYQAGDPYALREFSQHLHDIVQGELSSTDVLFPRAQRFHQALRDVVTRHVLGGWELHVDADTLQKRFVISPPRGSAQDDAVDDAGTRSSLPFLTWSAGQREFVPLLLGLYRLMPAGAVGRRGALDWAIIEEPEMGLHPRAIAATMAFVVELLRRQYRVVLSTHSTQVLDVVWGLRTLSELGGTHRDVAELLDIPETTSTRAAAQRALAADYRTYYFERGAPVRDISALDPMSDDPSTAGWGGLTAFSERVANVVARVVARSSSVERAT